MKDIVYIFADESCLGVQFTDRASPGGAAGLIEIWRAGRWSRREYWVSEPASTNNRMALRSAIEGLRLLKRPCSVVFSSDSEYLIRGIREWVPGWMARGWRRRSGAVENLALWRELVEAARRHEIDWRWIRGHTGHPQNEYVNWLAIRAAKEQGDSGGAAPSGFEDWLATRRLKAEFLTFDEAAPPPPLVFKPAPPLPMGSRD